MSASLSQNATLRMTTTLSRYSGTEFLQQSSDFRLLYSVACKSADDGQWQMLIIERSLDFESPPHTFGHAAFYPDRGHGRKFSENGGCMVLKSEAASQARNSAQTFRPPRPTLPMFPNVRSLDKKYCCGLVVRAVRCRLFIRSKKLDRNMNI
jgi:hypothetical protein